MTKKKKMWLGIFTFLPLLTVVLYVISFFFIWFSAFTNFDEGIDTNGLPVTYLVAMISMFLMMAITIIAGVGIMIYYILHANKHFNDPNDNQKLIWILVLILAGGIGNFVYYLAVIRPLKVEQKN